MRIIDGIKLKGYPAEIPACGRDDLPDFLKEMGFKVGAEIGVYKAGFTTKFGAAGLQIYGIDPWAPYNGFDVESENRSARQDFLYGHAKRACDPYPNITLIRKLSLDAAKDFADKSLDFVYIDGNHTFRYVADDLCEWYKKVRPGGVISGHDYIHPRRLRNRYETLQVKFVVDAFLEAYRIKNWWLLGRYAPDPGEYRDPFRSYMFFKP